MPGKTGFTIASLGQEKVPLSSASRFHGARVVFAHVASYDESHGRVKSHKMASGNERSGIVHMVSIPRWVTVVGGIALALCLVLPNILLSVRANATNIKLYQNLWTGARRDGRHGYEHRRHTHRSRQEETIDYFLRNSIHRLNSLQG